MASSREPLGSLSPNCMPSASTQSARKPVYPIFLKRRVASKTASAETSGNEHRDASKADDMQRERKRPRTSMAGTAHDGNLSGRHSSIANFFAPRAPVKAATCTPQQSKTEPERQHAHAWRRSRPRLGCRAAILGTREAGVIKLTPAAQSPSMLPYMVYRPFDFTPRPPSTFTMPSFETSDQHRDFDPALVLAFSDSAKQLSADEAQSLSRRRLLAIGGQEGGIRVLDVDGDPETSETTDYWWRAHGNGVFDLKWTNNDTRLLSASADLSLRMIDLASGSPRLLATMVGHTSTIKSMAILGPGYHGNGAESGVIASGGRDGNINIYDIRCPGRATENTRGEGTRRSSRMRSSTAIAEADGQPVEPVLVLRQPHNSTNKRLSSSDRSSSRTITSLVALQSMPGILASGGTYDGVVKLWDIRAPGSTSHLRPKCTPFGVLPDPTVAGSSPSRRPRCVNALCESPITGDLYALCGDAQVHVLRPSAATASALETAAIMPQKFVHPDQVMRSFYIRMSMSPDGRYLACGSSHAGVTTWDTLSGPQSQRRVLPTHFPVPSIYSHATPEVIAVDWGKDILAASSDDSRTRLWRVDFDGAQSVASSTNSEDGSIWGIQR